MALGNRQILSIVLSGLENNLIFHFYSSVKSFIDSLSDSEAVILGDHTNVSKDGRRMPCVVSLHQHVLFPRSLLQLGAAHQGLRDARKNIR